MKHTKEFFMKPKVDFCFKELMSDAEVRKGFLSAVLHISPDEIQTTTLLPTHLRKMTPEEKLGILDVYVLLNTNVKIDVEIQISPFPFWQERSLFYLSKMYFSQIHAGDSYESLNKCVHIGILDFCLLDSPNFYSCFHLWEDKSHLLYSDKLELHILELPKLKNSPTPETELFNWMRFFNSETKEEFEKMAEKDPYIKKAWEDLNHISCDEEKRLEYEAREKALMDYNHLVKWNLIEGRKQGLEEGREEGLKEGLKKGREEGLRQGRFHTITDLYQSGILSLDAAAQALDMTTSEFLEAIKTE